MQAFLNDLLDKFSQYRPLEFKNNPFRKVIDEEFRKEIFHSVNITEENYKIQGSMGQGNWALQV